MSFRLVPKSVTLNDLERRNGVICVISANSGGFRAHCVKAHVRYLISWWVLVECSWSRAANRTFLHGCSTWLLEVIMNDFSVAAPHDVLYSVLCETIKLLCQW